MEPTSSYKITKTGDKWAVISTDPRCSLDFSLEGKNENGNYSTKISLDPTKEKPLEVFHQSFDSNGKLLQDILLAPLPTGDLVFERRNYETPVPKTEISTSKPKSAQQPQISRAYEDYIKKLKDAGVLSSTKSTASREEVYRVFPGKNERRGFGISLAKLRKKTGLVKIKGEGEETTYTFDRSLIQ